MTRTGRIFYAVGIALIPMLIVALVAWLTGIDSRVAAVEAAVCTLMLLGFVAYKERTSSGDSP